MQYLLRPISTLSCFVSDAQNMAEAPGFGTSLLRSQSILLATGLLCRLGRHLHAWHAPMPDCPSRRARGRCMGTRFWQKVLCHVSVTILPSRRVTKLSRMMQIVDDGSGVIDCCIPYIKVDQTKSVTVQETGDPRLKMPEKGEGTTKMSNYYSKDTKEPPRRPAMFTESPEWEPRFLVPDIGDTIRVEGKPRTKFGERVVLVDKLGECFVDITLFSCLMVPSIYRAAFNERRACALAAGRRIPYYKILTTLRHP